MLFLKCVMIEYIVIIVHVGNSVKKWLSTFVTRIMLLMIKENYFKNCSFSKDWKSYKPTCLEFRENDLNYI